MAIHRVIAAGCSERQILVRVLAALRDPDVESVTVHKAGSQLLDSNGRECIVGPDGSLIPLRVATRLGGEPGALGARLVLTRGAAIAACVVLAIFVFEAARGLPVWRS